ncbi:MAG TPA: alpha/beta fold hydrolase [Gemmatimonadaceae bacterium]|jgi:pimeloyl-ACP methyl ester carboxylesterase
MHAKREGPASDGTTAGDTTSRWRRRWGVRVAVSIVLLVTIVAGIVAWEFRDEGGAAPNYFARDPVLRAAPIRIYRADRARAFLWFFGNDLGFWGAQQRLAVSLAGRGVDVVGFDLRAWLATRPRESAPERARAFREAMADLISRAERELGDSTLPVVVAGHSVGAEVALYMVADRPPPRLRGVVALSPGSRGHLRITAADLAFGEPTEPGSFAIDSVLHAIRGDLRVAIVRGANDRLRSVDSLLLAERPETRRVVIPLAAHSMKRLFIAGPMIEKAVEWAAGIETTRLVTRR